MTKLKNITISQGKELYPFSPVSGGSGKRNIPERNRYDHARYLEKQFESIWDENKSITSYSDRNGIYLEFRGKNDFKLVTKSLEDVSQNVRLCNIKEIEGTKHATVFLPLNKKDFFLKKINGYKEKYANKDVIESIENINTAFVDALWTDKRAIPEENLEGCEVWLSVYKKDIHKEAAEQFFILCKELQVEYYNDYIEFPERVVVAIRANKTILKDLLLRSDNIAEFRKTSTPTDFYIKYNDRAEQQDWIKELLSRTNFKEDPDTSICILDKGISNKHPLIAPVLKDIDMHTIFADGKVQDTSGDGHGTAMAGIATYYDLQDLFENHESLIVNHKLESVRIIDDKIENDSKLYGAITAQAISHAEITNPNHKRVIAMPITAPYDLGVRKSDKVEFKGDGKPTSWSAAVDSLAFGNYGSEERYTRLIILAAGNTCEADIEELDNYEDAVALSSVEDPAQSWNALTVGAYTEKSSLSGDAYTDKYKPLVEAGAYSPFNSSSLMWEGKWPIKPDIVLEGGNIGHNKEADDLKYSIMEHLSVLTISNRFHMADYLTTMTMTSPATAQAANIAARIIDVYPNIWAETVRGLIVHSAEWTKSMIKQVFKDKEIDKTSKGERRQLLRIVGHGVPSLERALYCAKNSVNLVVEDTIQPFKKKESSTTINEMALHEIPWPEDVLISLGDKPVKMKVTLSYFIDPSPGEIGWEDKYRYPGCRLYFDVNQTNEDKDLFLSRIDKKMRDSEYSKDKTSGAPSERWFLGTNNRDIGSIHSDTWEDTAANLAENRFIAVYPGGGWWKERTNLGKSNAKIRYSLIVSISTPEETIDLYTPIKRINTEIANQKTIETKIEYRR